MGIVGRMVGLVLACGAGLAACGSGKPTTNGVDDAIGSIPSSKSVTSTSTDLNLFIWPDYLAPDTVPNFERQTGIKVHVSYFDANDALEARLLVGASGFDVVVPDAAFFSRQIDAGIYLPLDKSKLPNLKNLDPQLMAKVSQDDPHNAHGIIYLWGTTGIGYNEEKIKALAKNAPLDSWRLVFDPLVASQIAPCGISLLDDSYVVTRAVLSYLGRDPNSHDPKDLRDAETALIKIRPFIRNINSSDYIEALANGDLCVAMGYNGNVLQARDRAHEANRGVRIQYSLPKEGSVMWFDMMAIPKDAPNPDSAYAFLNYLLTPQVIAEVSNSKRFANANAAANPLILSSVRDDAGIYPSPEIRQQLAVELADTAEQSRVLTRMWQKFKTGT